MKIISRRSFTEDISYTLLFQNPSTFNGEYFSQGFGFPCDKEGKVDVDSFEPGAQGSYQDCISGSNGYINMGIHPHKNTHINSAVGLCECGQEVHLSGFTNTCDCGADYNSAGQKLAPRSQWGEETGESLSDILSIP